MIHPCIHYLNFFTSKFNKRSQDKSSVKLQTSLCQLLACIDICLHPINNRWIEPTKFPAYFFLLKICFTLSPQYGIKLDLLLLLLHTYNASELHRHLEVHTPMWNASWQHHLEFPSNLIKQQFSEENAKMKFQFIIPIHSCSWVWKL